MELGHINEVLMQSQEQQTLHLFMKDDFTKAAQPVKESKRALLQQTNDIY